VGRKNILLASFAIFLMAYLGFALTQNIILIAALFVFYGAYEGYSARSASVCFGFRAGASARQRHRLYSTTVGLLQLVASVVAGLLWIGSAMGPSFFMVQLLPL